MNAVCSEELHAFPFSTISRREMRGTDGSRCSGCLCPNSVTA